MTGRHAWRRPHDSAAFCMNQGRYSGCGLEGGQGTNKRVDGAQFRPCRWHGAPSIASLCKTRNKESLPCCPG
ncbi:hypothetical protein X805_01640 [Sphaerotilus natans subsp. natans DSM 6575]|uniref:Uncharacterized protein n=1 Tax=Sphaerotilus natans subsp. natans DSM 6575 TaxID=1286631 RepID=A0A059KRR6_9BURK|nr:hypothetical protein X805_01640 [Sphaerotilus natans subsp. natans DSM 6575]